MEIDDDAERGGSPPLWVLVLVEAGLVPVALLLGPVFRSESLESFSWDLDAATLGLTAALPIILLMDVLRRWPVGPFARINAFLRDEVAPLLRGCRWPDLALVSLTARLSEEMLFRGVIQGAITKSYGLPLGLIAASVIFGLMHPFSRVYILLTALVGGYLGLVWVVSGNLLTVVVAHAVYDFVALLTLTGEPGTAEDAESE